MKFINQLSFSLLFCASALNAQMMDWSKSFGTTAFEDVEQTILTSDHHALMVGTSDYSHNKNLACYKVNLATGTLIWKKFLGGSLEDGAKGVKEVNNGYIIYGYTFSNDGDIQGNNGGKDGWIAKLDYSGNIVWQLCLGTSSDNDDIENILELGNQDLIVVQSSKLNKINGSGQLLSSINKTFTNRTGRIQLTRNSSNLITLHYIENGDYGIHPKLKNYTIDANLTTIDSLAIPLIYQGSNDLLHTADLTTIIENNDQTYSFLGYTSTYHLQGMFGRYDLQGNLLQFKFVSSPENYNSYVNDMAYATDGSLLLLATNTLPPFNGENFFKTLTKYTNSGEPIWNLIINPDSIRYTFAGNLLIDGDDYILATTTRKDERYIETPDSITYNDFSLSIINEPKYSISGKVFIDENTDCLYNAEPAFKHKLVRAKQQNTGDLFWASSDSSGNYTVYLWDQDSYSVGIGEYWFAEDGNCINTNNIQVSDITPLINNINIPVVYTANCPSMEVSVGCGILRRCFTNTYSVVYKNIGPANADNSHIDIQLDPAMQFISSSIPSNNLGNGLYRFQLGTVNGETEGRFSYEIYLSCGDSTILGETHCVEAHIYPDTPCAPTPQSPNIEVSGICEGDSILFTVRNISSTPMPSPAPLYVWEEHVLERQQNYQLNGHEELRFRVVVNGQSTYRLETYNPISAIPFGNNWGAVIPSATIEGCGATGDFNTGFVTQFSTPDDQPWLDIDCQQNVGSYDPNDKSAMPVGLGNNHSITTNDAIEYKIQFQNTGTDTAFTVRIEDALDPHLDPATIELGASSHAYTSSINANGAIIMLFNNINLPDSTTNEPASHGFVQFRIKQKAGNTPGTIINNTASIYFDFNAPIVTNTTYHEINNTNRAYVSIEPLPNSTISATVYPNPFEESATVVLGNKAIKMMRYTLTDLAGHVVQQEQFFNTNQFTISRGNLATGVYLYRIEGEEGVINAGKIVVR